MKKTTFLFIIFCTPLFAQHDIKLQVSGLAFGNYGIGYEYAINNKIGAHVSINFSNKYPNIFNFSEYSPAMIIYNDSYLLEEVNNFSSFSFSPEIRYYTKPKYGLDGSFWGLYTKIRSTDVDMTLVPDDYHFEDYEYEDEDDEKIKKTKRTTSGTAIGFTYGNKKVYNSGLFWSSSFGLGYYLSNKINFSDKIIQSVFESDKDSSIVEDTITDNIDFRVSISLGWRFGGN